MIRILLILLVVLPDYTWAQTPSPLNFQAGSIVSLPLNANPSDLVIADFNRDNRLDFAVTERGLNAVAVYRQQPSGGATFLMPGTSYAVGREPSSLVAIKLGNQSQPDDLIAVSGPDMQLYRLRNTGAADGSLTLLPFYGFATNFPARNPKLLAAYIDRDANMDLAYTHDAGAYPGLGWRLGQGGFEFANGQYVQENLSPPTCLAVADMDGDGWLDALTNRPASDEVKIHYGYSGGWNLGSILKVRSTGHNPVSVVGADVDGDSRVDLAIANADSKDVSILLNTGVTMFGSPLTIPQAGAPRQVLLEDLNRDNRPELLTINSDNTLNIYLNTGRSGPDRFAAPITLATGTDPVVMRVADLDGDGQPDVVVACAADNTVRVYRNVGASQPLAAGVAAALSHVKLYPNPATNVVWVQVPPTLAGPITVLVIDALGRQVRRQTLAGANTLEVADLPRGMYTVRFQHTLGTGTQRLVLQ